MSKSLTAKQRAFVEHYLTCWNAAEAARQAGYSKESARSIGPENLSKPAIARAIKARLEELKVSADEVLTRLGEQARSTMADFVDPTALPPLLKTAAESGKLHLVKKVTTSKRYFKGEVIEEKTEFELYDAQAALVHLGKHHRLFADRLIHENWRDEAVNGLRSGAITPDAAIDVFGDELARELFALAGIKRD